MLLDRAERVSALLQELQNMCSVDAEVRARSLDERPKERLYEDQYTLKSLDGLLLRTVDESKEEHETEDAGDRNEASEQQVLEDGTLLATEVSKEERKDKKKKKKKGGSRSVSRRGS